MLIDQGGSPKYIQDQVGHADIKTTFNAYGHLMPQAKMEATLKLEQSIFGDHPEANVRTFAENAQDDRVN